MRPPLDVRDLAPGVRLVLRRDPDGWRFDKVEHRIPLAGGSELHRQVEPEVEDQRRTFNDPDEAAAFFRGLFGLRSVADQLSAPETP